jgi:chitinase
MKIAAWSHRSRLACWTTLLLSLSIPVATYATNVVYEVDAAGRVTKATYPDGSYITYSYDPRGNRTGATVTDLGAPAAPGTPSFSNITTSTATASWTAATDNVGVTGYQYRLNGGSWVNVASSPASLTGLSAGTLYNFEVRARDNVPLYGPSTSGTFTTIGGSAPTAPGVPSFSSITATSATATWTAATDDVGVVSYEFSLNGGAWTSNAALLTRNLTGLASGVTYTFQVRALDSSAAGPVSSNTFTTLDNVAPSAPGNPTFSAITETTAVAAWAASTDNVAVTRYEVSLNGLGWVTNGLAITRNLTGLTPASLNTLQVRAVDGSNNTSVVSSNSFNTVDTTAPTTPGNPSFTSITSSSATATWAASTDNVGVTRYETSLNGASWTTNGLSTTRNLSGLGAGTSNTLQVRAFDAANNPSVVSQNSFTTVDNVPPSAPGTPSFSSITGTSATASWTAATDNVGVASYWYSFNNGAWTNNGSSLTLSLSGLTPATTYSLQVRARDSAQDGPTSSNSFTTVDTIPPGAPGTPSFSSVTGNSATASWAAASDNVGVTGYAWRSNGGGWNEVAGTSVSLSGLSPATSYTIDIRARDAAGWWGPHSTNSFTTPTLITISNHSFSTAGVQYSTNAWYQLMSSGEIRTSGITVNHAHVVLGDWLVPKSGMANYQARKAAGTCVGPPTDSWIQLNTSPSWLAVAGGPSPQSASCWVLIEISAVANPSVILDSATINMAASH